MMSMISCRWDHSFPWKYRDASFNTWGLLVCPSCATELERVWSFRTLETRPAY